MDKKPLNIPRITSQSRRCFMKNSAKTAAALTCASAAPWLGALTLDEAKQVALQSGDTFTPTWCGMCGPIPGCAIYAFTNKEGRFTHVAGMKEAPQNKGTLCPKAHAAPQWVYSADRILHPMRRVGKRGEGRFEQISWEEALRTVSQKLIEQKEQYGPESLSILSPARRDYSDYLYRFLMAHGSPNYGHSGICAMQLFFGFNYTLGARPIPDYENADVILIWGKQPVYSGPSQGDSVRLSNASQRGAKIYAIKPSVEADGHFMTTWVPVRPGTDAALALAMLHVITQEDLVDKAFVKEWCYGYEQLVPHVQSYTPQWAQEITGIPAQQIIDLARTYATTPKATIDFGNGLEHARSASDTIRSIAILIAITGHLDRPGGNLFPAPASTMPNPRSVHMKERYTQEWIDKLVGPEFPKAFQPFIEGTSSAYLKVFQDVLKDTPTIRTIIAPGTQPVVSTRDPRGIIKALEKLDFYVVIDTHRTADMNYADIVLPSLTVYETDAPFVNRGPFIMARSKVLEPVGEGRSTHQIMIDLGVAMGYGKDFWDGSMEACQNDQLEPLGMTIAELRKHPTGIIYDAKPRAAYENYAKVFSTPSPRLSKAPYLAQGKVAIYNTEFEKAGFSALPTWTPPLEFFTTTPEIAENYPLLLSDYHTSVNYSAGWQRNVPYLREIEPDPVLHIHPQAAQARKITHGDWVRISSPHGYIKARADVMPGIRPDTVMMLHGWWQGCRELYKTDSSVLDGGSNVNLLYTADAKNMFDPLVTAMTSQTLVEVSLL